MADEDVGTMPSVDEMLDMIEPDEPSSGEAPDDSSPEPAAEDAADLDTGDDDVSQPRDEQGRFVAKDDEEEAPPEDAEPAAAEEPPAEPEAVPAQPPEDAVPAQPEEESYPALSVRSYGQDHEIPGSMVGEDGVFIPTNSVPHVQRLLSQGLGARERESQLRAQIDAARNESEAEQAEAHKILEEFAALREQFKVDPDGVVAWFEDMDRNWATLQAQARAEFLEKQLEAAKTAPPPSPGEDPSLVLDQTLRDAVAEMVTYEEYQGIDGEEMIERFLTVPGLLEGTFRTATEDMPDIGVSKGEAYFDPTTLFAEFDYRKSLTPAASGPSAAETKAAEQNRKAVTESVDAPPVTPAAGGDAPSTEKEIPKFKTKAEADKWLDEESNWR
jgi:hypothetical protein